MFHRLLRLTPYAKRHRGKLLAIVVMTLMATGTTLLQPWPMKILVDYALGDVGVPAWLQQTMASFGIAESALALVLLAGALTFVIFAINSALDVVLSWAWMATGQRMVYDVACDTLGQLLRLRPSYHARHSVGDHLSRLSGDTWCVYKVISELLVSPFQRILLLTSIAIITWMLDPFLTVVSFSVAPLIGLSVWYFGPRLKQRAKRGREAQARVAGFVHRTVTSIPLVQAYNAEARNNAEFETLADNVVAVAQQGVLVNKSYAFFNGISNSASRAAVIFAGSVQVIRGDLTLGGLLVFLAYVKTLQDSCSQLLQTYANLKASEASLDRLLEIIDADDVVDDPVDGQIMSVPKSQRGIAVEFRDVSFGYETNRPVLEHLSLSIEAGKKVALVGPSGAGKSTLASLIPRLYDPWSGSIRLNGVDVRELTLDSLRSNIAVLLQEPYLLPLSVAANIAIGLPTATRDEIVDAAIAANAHEFIVQLADGYDTVLGQRGTTLSGGQKQRLAIARAFVRDAPLLILDEPTSALDVQTEASLLEAFQRLMEGRTTITIAHRLSTICRADRILVLQDGSILEDGTHEQLIRNGQLYEQFHAAQGELPSQEARA
jgi:ATP-binding cassette subfamily B protein